MDNQTRVSTTLGCLTVLLTVANPASAHNTQGEQTIEVTNTGLITGTYALCVFKDAPLDLCAQAGRVEFDVVETIDTVTWTCNEPNHLDTIAEDGRFQGVAGIYTIEYGQMDHIENTEANKVIRTAVFTIDGITYVGQAGVSYSFVPHAVIETTIGFDLWGENLAGGYFQASASGPGQVGHAIIHGGTCDENDG
jgi:hypothetical protein